MQKELSVMELDGESMELLPDRETLFFDTFNVGIIANNSSMALNAATFGSVANSGAWQAISVVQG